MRDKGCHQAHNAQVEICALFTTRNSLKLQGRRKAGVFTHSQSSCHIAKVVLTIRHDSRQIPLAARHHHTFPHRGFLVWGSFCQGVPRAANLLSFVSFFVRSQSPFLRPDPRFADAVARRNCQGWPPRQPCGMLRALPGHTLTGSSTTARWVRSG